VSCRDDCYGKRGRDEKAKKSLAGNLALGDEIENLNMTGGAYLSSLSAEEKSGRLTAQN
jgi:hypothetical protein